MRVCSTATCLYSREERWQSGAVDARPGRRLHGCHGSACFTCFVPVRPAALLQTLPIFVQATAPRERAVALATSTPAPRTSVPIHGPSRVQGASLGRKYDVRQRGMGRAVLLRQGVVGAVGAGGRCMVQGHLTARARGRAGFAPPPAT